MRRLFLTILLLLSIGLNVSAQGVSDSVEERKKQLESELAALEAQIKEQEALLGKQRGESATLTRDVSILTAEINKAKLSIKEKGLLINKLGGEIKDKTKTIGLLDNKLGKQRDSLAELLRKTNEIDDTALVHLLLSNKSIGEFYSDAESYDFIKEAIQGRVVEIKDTKELTEKQKKELGEKQDAEVNHKADLEKNKRTVEKKEGDKKELLSVSKSKEKTYEQIKKEKEKKAAEIRSALFALRDTAAIPFGKALEYATEASKKTGVRPAFLLAILKQESNMGENVGSCFVKNLSTGDGVGKNTGTAFEQVMKAPRDTVPFEQITAAIGLGWATMPVSCPPGYKYYSRRGFSGALGPSQFIPSTWQLFAKRIASSVGIGSSAPNPWDPKHAITASSLYLGDLGASAGTYTAERNAACRYYSGRACDSKKPSNSFYGDSVVKIAIDIQENMIDPLEGI